MKTLSLIASAFLVPMYFCAQHPANDGHHPPAPQDPRHHEAPPRDDRQDHGPGHGGDARQDPAQAQGQRRQGPDGPRGGNHDELRVLRDQLRETAHSMLRQADEIDKILGGPGAGPHGPQRQGPDDRMGPGGPRDPRTPMHVSPGGASLRGYQFGPNGPVPIYVHPPMAGDPAPQHGEGSRPAPRNVVR